MKAILRKIRISPKKANLVAGMVRGKSVNEALQILQVMPKKGADILYKVVHSAASNAQANFRQSIEELYITTILVTKGPTYKRSIPISRGRAHPLAKRTCHITVEVGTPVSKEAKAAPALEKEEKTAPAPAAEKKPASKKGASETAAKKTAKKPSAKAKPAKAEKSS